MNKDLEILKRLLAEADEDETPEAEDTKEEKPKKGSFEEDPMGFILKKYHSLNELMEELMTPAFKEYVDGIFLMAPKPTTFKVLLHNGQYFFLTFLGTPNKEIKDGVYEATVEGKRYYLAGIGEKERCMMAIARLLRYGSPLKTKGPEGAEQGTRDNTGMEGDWAEKTGEMAAGGEEGGGELPSTEDGGEELTEVRILEEILKKTLVKELTVSPNYKTKDGFNPYYTLKDDIKNQVAKELQVDPSKIVFKNVVEPKGKPAIDRKGGFSFQIGLEQNGNIKDIKYYVKAAKSEVTGHYGTETRKDSTASSNVNEFLSLYFIKHPFNGTAKQFMKFVKKPGFKNSGVFTGEDEEVSMQRLSDMIVKDESPERDINIGINNAKAVKSDLKTNKQIASKLYWTPRGKPEGISSKNPSDIIIKLKDGSFVGYSNKITSGGADTTPKLNTSLSAFAQKLGDSSQEENINSIIDKSWNQAASKVPEENENASKAIKAFKITKEKYSESASRNAFADLAREFKKDGLDFYKDDFYYLYRNQLIENLSKYWKNQNNLAYLLKTIGFYTYGQIEEGSTPCPYKLLIGTEKGSTVKEISSDEDSKLLLTQSSSDNIENISIVKQNKEGGQSFGLSFSSSLIGAEVEIPLTLRTRASGGWAGKSLYIMTPGLKITKNP
jgi:hypothetical protein